MLLNNTVNIFSVQDSKDNNILCPGNRMGSGLYSLLLKPIHSCIWSGRCSRREHCVSSGEPSWVPQAFFRICGRWMCECISAWAPGAGRVGLTFKCRGTLRRVGDGAPANRENTFRIEWGRLWRKMIWATARLLFTKLPKSNAIRPFIVAFFIIHTITIHSIFLLFQELVKEFLGPDGEVLK